MSLSMREQSEQLQAASAARLPADVVEVFSRNSQQLHAREVVVPISRNREPVRVAAPVPPHLRDWLTACGWNPETQ